MTIGLSYLKAEGLEMGFEVDKAPWAEGTAYMRLGGWKRAWHI